jgi:GNAT superfamily N-acetyltransferase
VDAQELLARHGLAHRAFYRLFDGASPGARVVERDDGLLVCVCPARPERSLVNAVVYDHEHAAALIAALPELAAEFDAAGAHAWTVWVHPGDDAVAQACAVHGHVLDATPELMWAPLGDGLAPAQAPAVTLDLAPSWRTVGDVNDAAYGLPPAHLAITLGGADPDPEAAPRAVALDDDGRPVACAAVVLAGDVAEVVLVAALPEARGRGLAAACIRSCLARARAQGATLTTLEATKMGEPLYAHMGYRRAGALGMWERRRDVTEIVG